MKVFYDERMVAHTTSYSPSSAKPGMLAQRLRTLGVDVQICPVEPVGWADFYLSHSREYVDGVRSLVRANGFGNRDAAVRDSLPFTTGSLVCAGKAALKDGVAWALASGFHHAEGDEGGGFCTFEGLTVASKKLINASLVRKAMILDGDFHYGNGCVDCIPPEWMDRIDYWHTGGDQIDRDELGARLTEIRPDIIFFQDGMDAYKYDPIGGGLTYHQLYERNKLVCQVAKSKNIPVVINLAGGYLRWKNSENELEPVLLGHTNGIMASLEVFEPKAALGTARVHLEPQPWEI